MFEFDTHHQQPLFDHIYKVKVQYYKCMPTVRSKDYKVDK